MRRTNWILLSFVLLSFGSSAALAEDARVDAGVIVGLEEALAVEVVVAFKAPAERALSRRIPAISATRTRVLAAVPEGGFSLTRSWGAVEGMAGLVTAAGLAALAEHPDVLAVSVPGYGEAHLADSVPLIAADTVHSGGNTGAGTEVAVIDSGIRSTHVDLSADLVVGQCYCSSSGSCCPNGATSQAGLASLTETTGHGTNVASIITSDGNAASVGVAPDADIAFVRIFNGGGTFGFTDLISALDWLINNRLSTVDVINMSIGSFALHQGICDGDGGAEYLLIASAIDSLREAGVLAVASAGNAGSSDSMTMPACLRNVVAVGVTYDANVGSYSWGGVCTDSTTVADQYACWSNTSLHTDIAAPGCKSTAAWYQGDAQTGWWCGTSQATPHVVGTAALVKAAYPFLGAFHLEHCLRNSTSSVNAGIKTLPLLDASHAVASCGFNFVSQVLEFKKLVAAFKKAGPGDDKLVLKAMVTPLASIDPLTEALTFGVRDVDGEVLSATLPAGAAGWFSKKPGKFIYKDKTGTERGVVKAIVKEKGSGSGTYKVLFKVGNTDLSRADTTSSLFVELLVGTNLHGAAPTLCTLKATKKLKCK